jgi:hypothetical protein
MRRRADQLLNRNVARALPAGRRQRGLGAMAPTGQAQVVRRSEIVGQQCRSRHLPTRLPEDPDYDSAKIQWGSDVRLGTWFEHDATVKDVRTYREVAGWEFFANVNAKNGFGAYSGWQSWRFRFRQDRLAAAEPVSVAPAR